MIPHEDPPPPKTKNSKVGEGGRDWSIKILIQKEELKINKYDSKTTRDDFHLTR